MQKHINTIDEVATRLRSANRWDNALSERIQSLVNYIKTPASDAGFHPSTVTKKIHDGTYESSKQQLTAVLNHRFVVCPADTASCLTMAVLLYQWETKNIGPPIIRHGSGGFVVAEWNGKNGGHVMIQHGQIFWDCAPKNVVDTIKHGIESCGDD